MHEPRRGRKQRPVVDASDEGGTGRLEVVVGRRETAATGDS